MSSIPGRGAVIDPDAGITPDTAVREAARRILTEKARPLFELEEAAASGTDADAVHDMRVASRRVREALRVFGPVYRRKTLESMDDVARSVTRTLGRVRDADVLIGAFERLSRSAEGAEERAVLAYLIGYRRGVREAELARMRKRLAGLGLRRQRTRFERATRDPRRGALADRPLGAMAREVIRDRLAEFGAHLPEALDPAAIETQHSMRIAGKHLRYAVETLSACIDPHGYAELHATLVRFQDLLGEMHDCDVWATFVEEAGRTPEAVGAGVRAEGVDALLADIAERRSAFFEQFRAHVDGHGPDRLRARIEALLLAPTPPPSTALVAFRRGPLRLRPPSTPSSEAKPGERAP